MIRRIGDVIVRIQQGDITDLDADAITNAANSDLWMGSGVAGAIKSKGGIEIEKEAMEQGPIQPGEAVITGAGNLKARHVLHCAGMPPGGKATFDYVYSSVLGGLRLASENDVQSTAFPAIGAGVGGLSYHDSAKAILDAVHQHIEKNPAQSIREIILVGFSTQAVETFEKALTEL